VCVRKDNAKVSLKERKYEAVECIHAAQTQEAAGIVWASDNFSRRIDPTDLVVVKFSGEIRTIIVK
jgi:1,2-phenylacetyl-CoA epoxidase PaaB subunit